MAMVDMKVGERIRAYRERLQMGVDALAEASGVNRDVIVAIEEGQTFPALGILVKLSRALGQRLGTFMDDQFKADPLIVRAPERFHAKASHKAPVATGLQYAPLGCGKPDRHMEPFFIAVAADAVAPLSSHEGEEFLYILTGEVLLVYGHEEQVLKAGDSVYYNSLVPHALRAVNHTDATLIATVFMPM